MKKSLILLLLLAGLVGLAVVTKKQKDAKLSENVRRGVSTREYLVPDLDVNAVKTVIVEDKDTKATLKQGADQWLVEERGGYGADFSKISNALMELRDTKIAGKQLLGKGAWAGENVLEPGEGVKEGTGTRVKLLDDKGGEIATLILGGNITVSGGNSAPMGQPTQRLVRIPKDEDSLWMVGSDMNLFRAKPEEWLDKTFVAVQDMATVTVTAPDAAQSWKASRPSKDVTDYTLEGLKEGEEFDPAKLSLSSLLSSASFNDVKPKAEGTELLKGANKAVITTFDGFTYDLQVAKVTKDGGDKFYLGVAVKADLPKARTPGKDEKEEDKKRLDDEFKATQDRLKEKLEKEKKLEAWVFEVAEYTVNNLLAKRSDLVKNAEPKKPEEAPPAAPGAAAPAAPAISPAPAMPAPAPAAAPSAAVTPAAPAAPAAPALKEPVSVTTPPVQAPAPKVEVKPAPAPDANPAEAPAAPAPAKP